MQFNISKYGWFNVDLLIRIAALLLLSYVDGGGGVILILKELISFFSDFDPTGGRRIFVSLFIVFVNVYIII